MKNTTYVHKDIKQNLMTTNNLDLNAMGLASLNAAEMETTNGGSLVLGLLGIALAGFAIGYAIGKDLAEKRY